MVSIQGRTETAMVVTGRVNNYWCL